MSLELHLGNKCANLTKHYFATSKVKRKLMPFTEEQFLNCELGLLMGFTPSTNYLFDFH